MEKLSLDEFEEIAAAAHVTASKTVVCPPDIHRFEVYGSSGCLETEKARGRPDPARGQPRRGDPTARRAPPPRVPARRRNRPPVDAGARGLLRQGAAVRRPGARRARRRELRARVRAPAAAGRRAAHALRRAGLGRLQVGPLRGDDLGRPGEAGRRGQRGRTRERNSQLQRLLSKKNATAPKPPEAAAAALNASLAPATASVLLGKAP